VTISNYKLMILAKMVSQCNAAGFRVNEDLVEKAELLLASFSDNLEKDDFQMHTDVFSWASYIVNITLADLGRNEKELDRYGKTLLRSTREEYFDSSLKLSIDEAWSKVFADTEYSNRQTRVEILKALKGTALSLCEILRHRKDFILEVSRNRRAEEWGTKGS